MDYPIKTLNQLRPILQGFRKASGLTQAMMAAQLGVTQQTYAQLEANPAAVSVERLFRVLRLLDADLTLAHSGGAAAGSAQEESAETTVRANKTSPLTGAARKSSAGKNPEVQRSTTKTARSSKKREDW